MSDNHTLSAKPGICDEFGYRIKNGYGKPDRCKDDDDEEGQTGELVPLDEILSNPQKYETI